MTSSGHSGAAVNLADTVALRPLTIDDHSILRYIHASAFKSMAGGHYPDDEITAYTSYIDTQQYADLIRGENILAGFIGDEMVATAGWAPADDNGISARIRSVFVRPMFTGIGIGRRMALEAETWARKSGFRSFGARVTLNAVGFFETLGYEVTSHGVQMLPDNRGLPVSFMRKSDRNAPLPIDTDEDTA